MTRIKTDIMILFLVLVAAANILLFILTQQNTASEAQLDTGLHATCYRAAVLRWSINEVHIDEAMSRHLSRVSFLPQTNCELAVDFPDKYSPPLPVNVDTSKARRLNAFPKKPIELSTADGNGNIK